MKRESSFRTASIKGGSLRTNEKDFVPAAAGSDVHIRQRGLQPLTFENDGVALVMVIIVCSMVVLGLIFTAAVRMLRRLVDWWASKKAARRALSSACKAEIVLTTLPISMSEMDVIDIGPIVPPRAHLRPPLSFSAIRRAALFHRPSSALSTIPSQAEEGSRSIPSVPSMAMDDDWRRISNVSSTPPRQSSRLSFAQVIPETASRSHCSIETGVDIYSVRDMEVPFDPYEASFNMCNSEGDDGGKRAVPAL
ncbi:hypothetical protein BDQ17DRAFT_1538882 [Cyathus striatus]|nr:hypothetical protein BDQ17DRAFT_1538882 [Cyathus striatus]